MSILFLINVLFSLSRSSEEADLNFEDYQNDWTNENIICLQLVCKIMEAFEVVLKEKLDQNIRRQETLLFERAERCRHFSSFILDLKSDERLWKTISTRIQ